MRQDTPTKKTEYEVKFDMPVRMLIPATSKGEAEILSIYVQASLCEAIDEFLTRIPGVPAFKVKMVWPESRTTEIKIWPKQGNSETKKNSENGSVEDHGPPAGTLVPSAPDAGNGE